MRWRRFGAFETYGRGGEGEGAMLRERFRTGIFDGEKRGDWE